MADTISVTTANSSNNMTLKRDFSRVVITLDNVLIPEEKLLETPSMLDGLEKDVETDLRILGCELIQTAGILLKLPQVRFKKHFIALQISSSIELLQY